MPRGEKTVPAMAGDFALKSRFQTNDRGLWSGYETLYAHAHKNRKWRPQQRTAASECCEWFLLTRVNLKL